MDVGVESINICSEENVAGAIRDFEVDLDTEDSWVGRDVGGGLVGRKGNLGKGGYASVSRARRVAGTTGQEFGEPFEVLDVLDQRQRHWRF